MRSLPVNSFSVVTHNRQRGILCHLISGIHGDDAKMRVKAVVRTVLEQMLDDNISAIVGISGDCIRVSHFAWRNGMDHISRLSSGVSIKWADIDSFVKTSVDDRGTESDRISHESVLASFPGLAYLSFEITLYILVEAGWIAVKQALVFGGQNEHRRLALNQTWSEQKISRCNSKNLARPPKSRRKGQFCLVCLYQTEARVRKTSEIADTGEGESSGRHARLIKEWIGFATNHLFG